MYWTPNLTQSKLLIIRWFLLFGLIMFLGGCAYFNTFYNAEDYFNRAEAERLKEGTNVISKQNSELYDKVIAKSQKTITQYPNSKYVARAHLLSGQSYYYIRQFDKAEMNFKILFNEFSEKYNDESLYWLALCKWKNGNSQPAIDNLKELLSYTKNDELIVPIYLSLADINLDLGYNLIALDALEAAAEITTTRSEKGDIHFRLAEIAFKNENFDRAIDSYEKSVKYSTSKEQVYTSNLNIVRSYRIQKMYKQAVRNIRSLLLNDRFETIFDDLELELAKTYLNDGDIESAKLRFESITRDYPSSNVSAEAYYQLGLIALDFDKDYEFALTQFRFVQRESKGSPYLIRSKMKVNEIESYQKIVMGIDEINEKPDSISTKAEVDDKLAKNIYTLGELEAFHFNHSDSAIFYFRQIESYPETDHYPKALFTLYHLYNTSNRTQDSESVKITLLNDFADTEYAHSIRNFESIEQVDSPGKSLLRAAENNRSIDIKNSIQNYKELVSGRYGRNDAVIPTALYYLANYFDNFEVNVDSALKYYRILDEQYPESDQAKITKQRLLVIQNYLKPDE